MNARAATVTLAVAVGLWGPGLASAQISPEALPATSDAADVRTSAESQAPAQAAGSGWRVSIYPILLWVPAFGAEVTVPPFPDVPGGPDLPGGSGSTSASFDAAALAGLSLEKANWRVDADGIWAALTTERERPLLSVGLDVIYGHVSGGLKVYKDLYVTGGVRRLALKYDIQLGDRPTFTRKPGLWDPLVGLGWHGALGPKWELHLSGEGGGFGVGADVDLSASVRLDWKMTGHFGITFGYSALHLEISDTVGQRTLETKQTLHGPVVGLGLYF